MARRELPTQALLRQTLDYDPLTGKFTWRVRENVYHSWNAQFSGKLAGHKNKEGYITITINDVPFLAHRLAWIYINGDVLIDVIDHIDGNPANNAISNLRIANTSKNAMNKRRSINNSSGVKGVYWHKARNKWAARIMVNGKLYHLGLADTFEMAVKIREDGAERMHGKFARHS